MNNQDHISESLKTIFRVKIHKVFDAYPGSGMKNIRIRDGVKIQIRDKHPRSATLHLNAKLSNSLSGISECLYDTVRYGTLPTSSG